MPAPLPDAPPPDPPPADSVSVELLVAPDEAGQRLDVFLARHFPRHSRVQLRKVIGEDGVRVNGRRPKVAYRLLAGDRVVITPPPLSRGASLPEDIPLEVLYDDPFLAAINKPPGMVVHPARGHWSGTLTSALAFHFEQLSAAGGANRPGIVHRLDRDTSGVILVAKTDTAHYALTKQFNDRTIQKEYFAIVAGTPDRDRDSIDAPIGLHPQHRERMAIRAGHHTSRDAQTVYEVRERFDGFAQLCVRPRTGRTHQIRVHLAHLGFPVLCDKQYGGRSQITRGEIRRDRHDQTVILARTALHAHRLTLAHPETGAPLVVSAPLPADLTTVLEELRQYRALPRSSR